MADKEACNSTAPAHTMDRFTQKDKEEARKFGEFYVDLIDNHKDCFRYYLSQNAVLDWFGQTVRGEKNIQSFVKSNISNCSHNFKSAIPVQKIGFRDTHVVKMPTIEPKISEVPRSTYLHVNGDQTPPNSTIPSTSIQEHGQGDGPHNYEPLMSPVKRTRLDPENTNDVVSEPPRIKYITCEGSMEFRSTSSKKFQTETKWNRPCKLHVAYSSSSFEDSTIYLVIYEGNVKCRRNLLKEFDSVEGE